MKRLRLQVRRIGPHFRSVLVSGEARTGKEWVARALHATVEIDQEIPQEHYRAVAEIIGYLMRLRRLVAR